jgi:2-succinyl-5-enolpyruvyl-6-hydroxy-3-cyclohexene-1-carboxylate synthase
MSNLNRAQQLLQKLYASGVTDFVVCPGGRNAPFVEALDHCTSKDIRVHLGFEERSAAFFALGLSLKKLKPVAVFTTSGTAFVETSSALLEAHYSGVPLIVVSADRPEIMWGSGSPQTMIQKDFLKSHLGASVDESYSPLDVSYPLHINCCFDEPLLDHVLEPWSLSHRDSLNIDFERQLNPYKYKHLQFSHDAIQTLTALDLKSTNALKILFLVTGLNINFKANLKKLFSNINADFYFEATGELRGLKSEITSKKLNHLDVMNSYDLVVRVGGIPTHRIWRDFELKNFKKILHFSQLPLPGMSFGSVFKLNDLYSFVDTLKTIKLVSVYNSGLNSSDKKIADTMVEQPVLSEEELFIKSLKKLSRKLELKVNDSQSLSHETSTECAFYIGNSLPIRHWDADKSETFNEVYASRGLNGIDGQLSTALGLAMNSESQKTIAVLGDLTTMYDLAAPWYWQKNKEKIDFTLVIINNKGGQIFSKMFKSSNFLNSHNFQFTSWAEMWGLTYLKVNSVNEFEVKLKSLKTWPQIIECEFK